MKKDAALGVALSIFSSVMIWQAKLLPRGNKWDLLGPASYPNYISWILLALSVLLILTSLKKSPDETWNLPSLVLPFTTFSILIAYVIIMPKIGFIVSTLLFLLLLQIILSPAEKKPWMQICLISLFFTYGIYYIADYLNVQLPILFF
ncbi:MAG: tripartite tricarboxylate transporter TctB family protein [Aminivibrio sp.]|jgi:hypothetical protein